VGPWRNRGCERVGGRDPVAGLAAADQQHCCHHPLHRAIPGTPGHANRVPFPDDLQYSILRCPRFPFRGAQPSQSLGIDLRLRFHDKDFRNWHRQRRAPKMTPEKRTAVVWRTVTEKR
jgi:hypothetical protein